MEERTVDQQKKVEIAEKLGGYIGRLISVGIASFFAAMGLLAIAVPIWLVVKMWQSL